MAEAAKVYHAACPRAIREQSEKLASLLGPAYGELLTLPRS
jgi:hypothetical protein